MPKTAALPFRANKRFVFDGRTVVPGDIVDVAGLPLAKVVNMERGNFGVRVAVETHSAAPAVARATPARKPSPRQTRKPRATSGASATKG